MPTQIALFGHSPLPLSSLQTTQPKSTLFVKRKMKIVEVCISDTFRIEPRYLPVLPRQNIRLLVAGGYWEYIFGPHTSEVWILKTVKRSALLYIYGVQCSAMLYFYGVQCSAKLYIYGVQWSAMLYIYGVQCSAKLYIYRVQCSAMLFIYGVQGNAMLYIYGVQCSILLYIYGVKCSAAWNTICCSAIQCRKVLNCLQHEVWRWGYTCLKDGTRSSSIFKVLHSAVCCSAAGLDFHFLQNITSRRKKLFFLISGWTPWDESYFICILPRVSSAIGWLGFTL